MVFPSMALRPLLATARRTTLPQDVAECEDRTHQKLYAGPTEADVRSSVFEYDQLIKVTQSVPGEGTVETATTAAAASATCNYPPRAHRLMES